MTQPVAERRVRRRLGRARPGAVGGYVILGLLALIYLIPLMFVLFVSLMSSRQFALNAASIPRPDHVVELSDTPG